MSDSGGNSDVEVSEEGVDRLLESLSDQVKRLHAFQDSSYRLPVPIIEVPEYNPQGRFIDFLPNAEGWDPTAGSWSRRSGVPYEVSTPEGQFIPFKTWMMRYARGWLRFIEQPDLKPDPELFGDAYSLGGLFNFFSVVRARVKKNVIYAMWSRLASQRMNAVLTVDIDDEERSAEDTALLRIGGLAFYLFPRDFLDSNELGARLREFIAAEPVKECFYEYKEDYLDHYQATSNSFWNVIQPRLGDTKIDLLRQKYGSHGTDRLDIYKGNWNHEDHACRFILCLYDVLRGYLSAANVMPSTARGFERYAFSETYSPDMVDQYWFGWALLTFLVKCWQHNQSHPLEEYGALLAPVLYPGWPGGNKVDFPHFQIGMINLNPDSKWSTEEFPNRVPVNDALEFRVISEEDAEEANDPIYESETDPSR
ncbi:hypothetical protein F4820DRAFT_445628 [Hypoxylon rubiginosum]|uniref:Uncharacterized protein n=1 Tax=Hypoxylon rubiginosum TaxID=110542 RepID=A0ACB9Z7S0_9PEZI|nr:hypothetical protein F4820DRAFT_445628 [Hypoxylon rubiginosum]